MPLTASTVTRTVSVDGASVTCHDSVTPGELDRPLVLVHGTGGTTASHFGHLFPMMATRTRVIAVDWAPTADPAADLTVDLLVGQVRAAVDELLGPDAAFDLLGTRSAPSWPGSWPPTSVAVWRTSCSWPAGRRRMSTSACATRSGGTCTPRALMPWRVTRPSAACPRWPCAP